MLLRPFDQGPGCRFRDQCYSELKSRRGFRLGRACLLLTVYLLGVDPWRLFDFDLSDCRVHVFIADREIAWRTAALKS